MAVTGVVQSEVYREHRPGPGHPESPARYDAVLRGIAAAVPEDSLVRLDPRPASGQELELCHTRAYIDLVRCETAARRPHLSTGDTNICARSWEVALLAAGGALTAVEAVMDGRVRNAFCCLRPPGHHASADRGMGFCVFNNVALAACYALSRYDLDRVLIVDWDVHHGNGTQAIFYDDPRVFYFSTHQWPCYPGSGLAGETGAGAGQGTTLNCPVGVGAGRTEAAEQSFRRKLVPAVRAFRPELVLISAGFDGRAGDMIGGLVLADEDFEELTGICMDLARQFADDRIVSVLEGGYDTSGLASAVGAHVRKLAET